MGEKEINTHFPVAIYSRNFNFLPLSISCVALQTRNLSENYASIV